MSVALTHSSGSFAIFAAIRRCSSRVSNFATMSFGVTHDDPLGSSPRMMLLDLRY
jgi:hypothetical protein